MKEWLNKPVSILELFLYLIGLIVLLFLIGALLGRGKQKFYNGSFYPQLKYESIKNKKISRKTLEIFIGTNRNNKYAYNNNLDLFTIDSIKDVPEYNSYIVTYNGDIQFYEILGLDDEPKILYKGEKIFKYKDKN